ncbi:hypothetical protein B9Z19DRAFT_570834 [Tuber borchii]|uniref:Uncharacterized protein n=1 Tax=Tuber borchii TaxID=42251 RepID=A0A2T6ZCG0_TUBBO|nr:hypothetical protein B9Z19DRAFT_570834 [Tuber borchii]
MLLLATLQFLNIGWTFTYISLQPPGFLVPPRILISKAHPITQRCSISLPGLHSFHSERSGPSRRSYNPEKKV